MKIIAGLGNPGQDYAKTRHNVGFMAIDEIAKVHDFQNIQEKHSCLYSSGYIDEYKIILAKPLGYMNNSGVSLSKLVNFYKVPLQDVIVIHDDLDLEVGKVRIKVGGSDGGHNGLKSIDCHLGKDYIRIRVGIGHPGRKEMVNSYVLNNFAKSDQDLIELQLYRIASNFKLLLSNDKDLFLNKLAQER